MQRMFTISCSIIKGGQGLDNILHNTISDILKTKSKHI